jgi:hypothetical protein
MHYCVAGVHRIQRTAEKAGTVKKDWKLIFCDSWLIPDLGQDIAG